MSHLECIGLSALPLAVPDLWTDPRGAALKFHFEDGAVACVTPFFVSPDPTVWRVGTTIPVRDDGCIHCSGADCDLVDASGEMITRTTVQLLDFASFDPGRTSVLEVVAFAHHAVFCRPEDFAAESKKVLSMGMADISFLPVGMFGPLSPVGERAISIFAGRVEAVRSLRCKADFVHVRVRTLPGPIDVVLPEAPEAHIGQQALVEAWLVARPLLPGSG